MSSFQPPKEASRIDRSYFPASNSYLMSEGMKRARAPYVKSNILMGGGLLAFVAATYYYVVLNLRQEDFSDVPTIPTEKRAQIKSIEDEERERLQKQGLATTSTEPSVPSSIDPTISSATLSSSSTTATQTGYSSFWSSFVSNGFGKGSPSHFIVDAPHVDKVGRVGDRSTDSSSKRLV